MVYAPSEHQWQEFMACPTFARLTMAETDGKLVPTLLLKSTALSLKYLIRNPRIRLMFFALKSGQIGYGAEIKDDEGKPATVWSLISFEDEVAAILQLATTPRCIVHLFNEIGVNAAWVDTNIPIHNQSLLKLVTASPRCPPVETDKHQAEVRTILDAFREGKHFGPPFFVLEDVDLADWKEVRSVFLTKKGLPSPISIFSDGEGGQQEALAHWLVDQLEPNGAVRSPQVEETSGKKRELTDILLSYDRGAFLIESKALNILGRADIPDRAKLTKNIAKSVHKAIDQLVGAIKNLQRGCTVKDSDGSPVVVDRLSPAHAIVLVPDLDLLAGLPELGRQALQTFGRKTRGFLHLLDPTELMRMVQNAERLSSLGTDTTRMMAFDFSLVERFKQAMNREAANFDFLLRTSPGP